MLSGCFSCTGANTGKSHAILGVLIAVAVTTIILGIVVVIVRIIRKRSSATGPPESEDFAYDDTGYSVSNTPSVVTVNGGLDVTNADGLVTTEHETVCKTTHLDGNAGEKEIVAGNSIQEKFIVTLGHLNESLAVDLTPVSHNKKRENTEFDEKFEGGSSVPGNEVVAEFVDTTTISGI